MKNLSNREKLLLLILAVIVFIGLMMRFVLMPNLEAINQNRALIAEYEVQQEEIRNEIANYEEWKKMVAVKEKELEQNVFFAKNMNDTAVDTLVQKLAKENGVEIIASDIYDPRLVNVNEFLVQQPFLSYPLREQKVQFDTEAAADYEEERAHAQSEETQETSDEQGVSDRSVPIIRNTVTVAGKTENVMRFIDAVSKLGQSIYVSNVESGITGGIFAGEIAIDVYYTH